MTGRRLTSEETEVIKQLKRVYKFTAEEIAEITERSTTTIRLLLRNEAS